MQNDSSNYDKQACVQGIHQTKYNHSGSTDIFYNSCMMSCRNSESGFFTLPLSLSLSSEYSAFSCLSYCLRLFFLVCSCSLDASILRYYFKYYEINVLVFPHYNSYMYRSGISIKKSTGCFVDLIGEGITFEKFLNFCHHAISPSDIGMP